MPVDNRYTGVGYEPPFETPSDKDFMSAHIESLDAEIAALRERQRALVEILSKMLDCCDRNYGKASSLHIEMLSLKEDARAALASKEV